MRPRSRLRAPPAGRWSTGCARSRSTSRDLAPAASRRSARSRQRVSKSARSPTSPPSRTTAAAPPSGVESERGGKTMARYTEAVCRLCRREGAKLYLKGSRCYTKKCAFERRPSPPGQHGVRRRKVGEFGLQLREKQKVRRVYAVLERQFKNEFESAEPRPGVTGENLLRILELRLDNVVYRMGFTTSRAQARQLVGHGHFAVNGRPASIPSFQLACGHRAEVP